MKLEEEFKKKVEKLKIQHSKRRMELCYHQWKKDMRRGTP